MIATRSCGTKKLNRSHTCKFKSLICRMNLMFKFDIFYKNYVTLSVWSVLKFLKALKRCYLNKVARNTLFFCFFLKILFLIDKLVSKTKCEINSKFRILKALNYFLNVLILKRSFSCYMCVWLRYTRVSPNIQRQWECLSYNFHNITNKIF